VVLGLRDLAATLAFTGILAGAAIVTRLAATLALAGILALAIVLGSFSLLGLLVLSEQSGTCNQTCGHCSESNSKLSAIHF
jgi:hypothetical protein